MRQLISYSRYMLLIAAFFMSACAQFGLQQAKSVDDNIQYGKAAVTAAYQTIGDLKSQGLITQAQGQTYFARVKVQETNVSLAESLLKGGKPVDANSTIDLALRSLVALRSELDSRSK